jgi:hypothetical protein
MQLRSPSEDEKLVTRVYGVRMFMHNTDFIQVLSSMSTQHIDLVPFFIQ